MSDVRISVIIPTIGRDTLWATYDSCAGADEIIIVLDRAVAGPTSLFASRYDGVAVKLLEVNGGDHGYEARTKGMEHATGTHLCYMDDDDVYLPDAFELMREAACDVPVLFRMDHYDQGIIWRTPELYFGNVSTQMVLAPNEPTLLGSWVAHAPGIQEPGGDYTFIVGCVELMGEPVWREEIISRPRPHVREEAVA